MGKGKKVFIDRKNAVTFHLVHRSQHDPLVTDDTAPQHVLVEALPQSISNTDSVNTAKRYEEQKKFGIFFDDDYDYLQHLKKPEQEVVWEYVENPNQVRKRLEEGRTTTAPKLALPSSVFASEYEEDEGMLNRAAPVPGPRPDWDPDVVAALDEDFDFDNEDNLLEDDFVLKAMAEGDDNEQENSDADYSDEDDKDALSDVEEDNERDFDSDNLNESDDEEDEQELMDRLGPLLRKHSFNDEETKSRFTEYSMSSSVIRRNDQLTLLDDRFERFYATYDDPELGDLACEEIEGDWDQKHRVLMACYREHKRGKKVEPYKKEWDRERVDKYRDIIEGEDPNDELIEMEIVDDEQKKWDCNSVLSTYSNIYNHPKLIEEPTRRSRRSSKAESNAGVNKIEIDPKTGLPANVLRNGENNQLTEKSLAKLDAPISSTGPKSLCNKSLISTLSVLSIRPKDETPEEKRERKRLLKEYRLERRIEKKANAEAFKEEKKRQTHVKINQKCNQQGTKII